MRDQWLTGRRAEPGYQVERARREADFIDDLRQQHGADRGQVPRASNTTVQPRRQRVGDLRPDLVQREIPRRDGSDHADRLAHDAVGRVLELEAIKHLRRTV